MPASQTEENAAQHAWEDSKENFQPVRDGRKPDTLVNVKLKEERTVLQPRGIEAERRQLVEAIEGYTGDDPLEKWVEYIKWTRDNFASGGKTSELLPLLEKCTREFHQSEQYRDDIRYLRVWIMYADSLPDPSDVFSYMMDHNIGQVHALFFIAYATFCELTRNYALADSIYQRGIQAKAAPLDRLETKFSEFQHRMVRRIQRKASEQQVQQVGPGANERRGLKTIRGPLSARPLDKRRNIIGNSGSNAIPVFEDDQLSGSTVQPPPRGRMVLPAVHTESQKENVQAAVPWMGQTMKQNSLIVPSKPKDSLEILEDAEFAASRVAGSEGGDTLQTVCGKASLRQRFDRDGLEEQLSSDPLLLLKNPPPKEAPKLRPASKDADETKQNVEAGTQANVCAISDVHIDKESSPFDQDVTMATSDAYKAMNCLFSGEATGDRPEVAQHADPGEHQLDLGMTINTRDALYAVNNMFKASFNVGEDRDDTLCLSSGNAGEDNTGSLMIREDTVFLPRAGSHVFCDEDGDSGAFSIREDTVFISRGSGRDDGNETVDADALSVREDTVFISNPVSTTNVSDLHIPIEDFDVSNDENAVPDGLVQLAQPRRQNRGLSAPLSPLGTVASDDGPDPESSGPFDNSGEASMGMTTGRNEIKIAPDDQAEAALASGVSPADGDTTEDFAVYEDGDPDQRRINPFDSDFRSELVASLSVPVSKWPGVYQLSNQQAESCRAVFKRARNSEGINIELKIDDIFHATIHGQIGEGAYATVYGAMCAGEDVALKVEHPPCPWEYLLCKIIEGRSGTEVCRTVNPTKMLLHEDFSVIIMPRGSGTLQDLLNKCLAAKAPIEQSVAATLCLSIFQAVKQLHDNRVVHNDIKPDNILLNISDDGDQDVSVSLIDVGRGVDLELLPNNAILFGDSGTESFRCIEMRERVPWLWQADAYAVAGVVHCLIQGKYMEIERATKESTGETFIRTRSKLPRSYDTDTWENVFKTLLNVKGASPPDWEGLIEAMQRVAREGGGPGLQLLRQLLR